MTAALLPERLPLRISLRMPAGQALSWVSIGLFGLLVLVALLAPVLAPHDPVQPTGVPSTPPFSPGAVLGTDTIGRDVLSRLLYGLRSTLPLALLIVGIGIFVGGTVGTLAGVTRGWIDNVLMRVTDLFLALPVPLVAIAIVASLGSGAGNMLLGVSIVWWPYFARIVRGEVVSIGARPHVEAARMTGVKPFRLAVRHILPGVLPTIVVLASLDVGAAALVVSSLSFLGLGTPPPSPELGGDAAQNIGFVLQAWWIPVVPGVGVLLIALISNLAGTGVRNLLGK